MIDFSMSGINFLILLGVAVLLEGLCLLILQNPFKNWKRFVAKDFIIFAFETVLIIIGLVCLILGFVNAAPLMFS